MGYYMDNGAQKITDDIQFIGKGKIDGKDVEISFNAFQILIIRENNVPKLTIYPTLNKEKETYFEMKTLNEDRKDPFKVNGKYIVMFKKPNSKYAKNETKYQTFEGVCENFVATGKCAFSNENGEMLIVHYDDIVQLKPIIE